ncbi:GmrSD restriction endonuclease domain-containing protein [Paradevosia shaoguanensis]|uniref:DUF262 domain-containing protein n=1 Tax=Paradevosia shaoguanensis TaxID=1335043 RepID=A0AA41UFL0_9HYPH|nr:DUF262 domain-containing protein [Paradevosia shaoguanensis]MCF1742053.1 DUF262 domain-containing protein [Paradevosia shaoguanensis]MCI0126536.1 DUF262 domain-containing protein [Paradevosia shaoguanensis]
MFDSTKQSLKALFEQIDSGKLQLPEFQRDYVWTEVAVVSLLASIAKGYPVGALLTLERGGEVSFKPRPIVGTPPPKSDPETLLLDGQQRMTSLYQALYSKQPALMKDDRGNRRPVFFYLRVGKALEEGSNFEEAVEIVPAEKVRFTNFGRDISLDLRSPELEYEQGLFPLNQTFDPKDWLYGWRDHWKAQGRSEIYDLEKALDRKIIDGIQRYEMPIIKLKKDNGREAVCTIFEKVNVGGVKLDAFDLVTAIYAGSPEGFDLRADWMGADGAPGRSARIADGEPKGGVSTKIASTDFLQACTILHTMELREQAKAVGKKDLQLPQVSCRRETMLSLPLEAYKKYADKVEAGFREASDFLNGQRILYQKDLPYPPQQVVLATFFAAAGKLANNADLRNRLSLWFWTGALCEYYGSATETKVARDVPQLVEWLLEQAGASDVVSGLQFQTARLRSLRRRVSAAYKAFNALLMLEGCRDFVSGKEFGLMTLRKSPVDVHHIFPQSWCRNEGLDRGLFDSIINKTPLSADSNRYIVRGDAPSVYLRRIEDEHHISSAQLDDILRSHLINPDLLRADDFDGFIADREQRLAEVVQRATGKAPLVVAGPVDLVADDDFDDDALDDVAA